MTVEWHKRGLSWMAVRANKNLNLLKDHKIRLLEDRTHHRANLVVTINNLRNGVRHRKYRDWICPSRTTMLSGEKKQRTCLWSLAKKIRYHLCNRSPSSNHRRVIFRASKIKVMFRLHAIPGSILLALKIWERMWNRTRICLPSISNHRR